MKINILPESLKNWFLKLITPIVDYFISHNLNPNWFTTIGFILSVGTTYLFAVGELRLAGVFVLLAGIFDIIDGRVARATNRVTKFGALYDSTLDRYSEVFVFFGLAYFFVNIDPDALWRPVAVAVALGGSMMVSYIRARAEGLNLDCKVGLMQRPERVVSLGVGALISQEVLTWVIIAIAVLANFTAIQRLHHVWIAENGSKREPLAATRK